MSQPIICYEILHDGEGERGKRVEMLGTYSSVAKVAEDAAEYFQDIEASQNGLDDSDLDRTSVVIEVDGWPGGTRRFRVACRVRREYTAISEPCPNRDTDH